MTSGTHYNSQADFYFGMLQNLSAESKLELISKLSQSLLHPKDTASKDEQLSTLFGAYTWDGTAEEVIESIRSSRVSNREIEPL